MASNYETASIGAASSGSSITENNLTEKTIPIFLQVGTPVSAKYRGAFCEASVEKVDINFKIKAHLLDDPKTNSVITIRWPLDKKDSSSENYQKKNAVVQKVFDQSTYTVVFDDGDKRCLKRTQLVIKGARHFKEGESLDQLPLTNPEHFKQPVINKKISKSHLDDLSESEDNGMKTLIDVSANELKEQTSVNNKSESGNAGTEDQETKLHEILNESPYLKKYFGRVVMVDMPINIRVNESLSSSGLLSDQSINNLNDSQTTSRRRRGPALVCIPSADPGKLSKTTSSETTNCDDDSGNKTCKTNSILVRFFKDGKFCVVPTNYAQVLSRYNIVELAHQNSANQQVAFERAILWYDRHQLPIHWISVTSNSKSTESTYNQLIETHLGTLTWRKILKNLKLKDKINHQQVKSQGKIKSQSSQPSPSSSSGRRKKTISESKKIIRKNPKSKNKRQEPSNKSNNKSISSEEESDDDSNIEEEKNVKHRLIKKKPSKSDISSSENEDSTFEDDFLDTTESSESDSECLDNSGNEKTSNVNQKVGSSLHSKTGTGSTEAPANSSQTTGSILESFEAKDRWIANLYRFMEERGTPINKAPSIGNKDLDLYRLHKIVLNYGGFQRVTNNMQWITIFSKLGLPPSFTAGPKHLQTAYKKYLYPLDDLNRKLGASLDTSLVSSTGRRSHNSGNHNTTNQQQSSPPQPPIPPRSDEKRDSESGTDKSIAIPVVEPVSSSGSIISCNNKLKSEENQLTTPSPPHLTAESPIKNSTSFCPSTVSSTPNIINNNLEDSSPNFSGSEPKSFESYQPDQMTMSDASKITSPIKLEEMDISQMRKQRKRKKNDNSPDDDLATPIKNIRKDCQSTPNKLKKNKSEVSGSPPNLKIENSNLKSESSRGVDGGPKRSLEPMDFMSEPNSMNTSLLDICQTSFDKNRIIPVGSKVFVRFAEKFYPAKVIRLINRNHIDLRKSKELNGEHLMDFLDSTNPSDIDYKVHYSGWNTRHDEIVDRERIVKVIEWAPNINRPPSSSSMNFGSCGCMDESEFDLKTTEEYEKNLKRYAESEKGSSDFRVEEEIEEELLPHESMSLVSNTPSASSSPKTHGTKQKVDKENQKAAEHTDDNAFTVLSIDNEESKGKVNKQENISDNETKNKQQEKTPEVGLVKRKAGRPRKTNKIIPESSYARNNPTCDQHQMLMMMSEEDTASDIVTTSAVPVFRNHRGRNPKLYGRFNRISQTCKGSNSRKTDGDSDSRCSNLTSSSGRAPRPRGRPPGKSRNMAKTGRSKDEGQTKRRIKSSLDESDIESKCKLYPHGRFENQESESDSRESESDVDDSDGIDENGDLLPRMTRRQHKMILGNEHDRTEFPSEINEGKSIKSKISEQISSEKKCKSPSNENQNNDLDNTVEAVLSLSRTTPGAGNIIMPRKTIDSDVEDHLSPLIGQRQVKEDDLTSLGSTIGMNNPYDIAMAKDDIDIEKKSIKGNIPKSSRSSIDSFSSNTSLDENIIEDHLHGSGLKNTEMLSPSNTVESSNAFSAEEITSNFSGRDRIKKTSESERSSVSKTKSTTRQRSLKQRSKTDAKSEVNSIESYQSSDNESRTNDPSENFGSPTNQVQRIKDKQQAYSHSCHSPKASDSCRGNASSISISTEFNNLHGPFLRRFGGPYFPITGLKNFSSEEKCQALQVRMRQILDAWRLAKQFQKDLDPRASKSKRNRAAIQLLSIGHGKSPFNQTPDNQILFS